ncbi:HEAT repeat domain-containing protein [Spirosoma fluminis]
MEAKPINCENAREQFTDWLGNQMPDVARATLETHVMQCAGCQQELHIFSQLWRQMGDVTVPEPSDTMRVRFHTMLDTYKDTVETEQRKSVGGFFAQLREFFTPQPAFQVAYSLVILCLGLTGGYWLHRQESPAIVYQQQIDTLSGQVREMRQMMLLSLLENPSASERLRAVSYTSEINQVDDHVAEALLTTLNNDPNVNVRLVTLEALAKLAKDPKVREGLVQSITQQDSPLVQSALADVMVKLQEKRSIKQLRRLLNEENLNDLVKSKIQQSIKELS